MAKVLQDIRVHELAKELCLSSKGLVTRLQAIGITVRGHMSVVPGSMDRLVRSKMPKPSAEQAAKHQAELEKRAQRSEQRRTQRRKVAAKKKAEAAAGEAAADDGDDDDLGGLGDDDGDTDIDLSPDDDDDSGGDDDDDLDALLAGFDDDEEAGGDDDDEMDSELADLLKDL